MREQALAFQKLISANRDQEHKETNRRGAMKRREDNEMAVSRRFDNYVAERGIRDVLSGSHRAFAVDVKGMFFWLRLRRAGLRALSLGGLLPFAALLFVPLLCGFSAPLTLPEIDTARSSSGQFIVRAFGASRVAASVVAAAK